MLGRWMSEKKSVCMYIWGEGGKRVREGSGGEGGWCWFLRMKYFFCFFLKKYIYTHKHWAPPLFGGLLALVYGVC